MRAKYVEERIGGEYFIFGGSPESGCVDIASSRYDTVATVSPEDAARLIADRKELVDLICAMADAFDKANPEAFSAFWYGNREGAPGYPFKG